MANYTVSFSNKKAKEAELKAWLLEEGTPMATAIKDKLYEYKRLLDFLETLKQIGVAGDQLSKLAALSSSISNVPELKQKEKTEDQPKSEVKKKVKKRDMPENFML